MGLHAEQSANVGENYWSLLTPGLYQRVYEPGEATDFYFSDWTINGKLAELQRDMSLS